MAYALLRGQHGIGMLGLQRSLASRSCSARASVLLAAATRGKRTSAARTTSTSSSTRLPDVLEPEGLQVANLAPPSSSSSSTPRSIVHNGISFAANISSSSSSNQQLRHSSPDTLLQSPLLPTAAELNSHDNATTQHGHEGTGHSTAADTADQAPASVGGAIPPAVPEASSTEAAAAAAAHTAPHSTTTTSSSSSSSNSSSSIVHQTSVLVIEAFAANYQVARQVRLINSDAAHTGLRVSAYAAVELNGRYHQCSPNAAVIGVSSDRHTNLNGSMKDAAVQGQLLRFVQRMLQQSADGSGQHIDSVVLFASPAAEAACDVYSIPSLSATGLRLDPAGRLLQPQHVQQQQTVQQLQQQLYEADRHVACVLELYRIIQALCAAADEEAVHAAQITAAHNQNEVQPLAPTLTRLVMVGPWNDEQLLLPMSSRKLEVKRQRAAAAVARQRQGLRQAAAGSSIISYTTTATDSSDAADDEAESEVSVAASGTESEEASRPADTAAADADDSAMEVVAFGLHRRPCLEPQLAGSLTGGSLHVNRQPWCTFGELKGELPPLAVITDMPGLADGGCICSLCEAAAAAEQGADAEADTEASSAAAGAAGSGIESSVQGRPPQPFWPEALVLTLLKRLQGQVAEQRVAAAQRAADSAAAAAAGPAAASGTRGGRGSRGGVQRGSSNGGRAAAGRAEPASSRSNSRGRAADAPAVSPPAAGTTVDERRRQLQILTKPVLTDFARTEYGLRIKTKTKKADLVDAIIEDERVTGKLT